MKPEELLKKGLQELSISCSEKQISSFMTYLSELKKWTKAYNLTALKTDEDIIIKHFLDSLLYIRALPEGIFTFADAGAGAGFPGIPVKIVRPETELVLVESSRKKTAFLRHIVRLLELSGTEILELRLENLGREYEKAFDVVVSRATFRIKEFLHTACPYVKEDGRLVLSKGPKWADELKEFNSSHNGSVMTVIKCTLPMTRTERNLVVLQCGEV
jgi:16S rRNA (guanine527-N7)-methyltransferase